MRYLLFILLLFFLIISQVSANIAYCNEFECIRQEYDILLDTERIEECFIKYKGTDTAVIANPGCCIGFDNAKFNEICPGVEPPVESGEAEEPVPPFPSDQTTPAEPTIPDTPDVEEIPGEQAPEEEIPEENPVPEINLPTEAGQESDGGLSSQNQPEEACGKVNCGQAIECPNDSCDQNSPYEKFLDYPESGVNQCIDGECIQHSCTLISSKYSKDCDKDDDNDNDPDETDPNPTNQNIFTGATEKCDGLDNDGNGKTDDGLQVLCPKQEGVCSGAVSTCNNGRWSVCSYGPNYATNENNNHCDGLDNDCFGDIDEGCDCEDGDSRNCGITTGECSPGFQECENGNWGSCINYIGPKTEICNSKDDDCDGFTDEDSFNREDYSIQIECNINSCSGFLICTSSGMSSCILSDDDDLDQVCSETDNCIDNRNSDQRDSDGDSLGDACDACQLDPKNDMDDDGICGNLDNCINVKNPAQTDTDRDGFGDACDACANDKNNDIDSDSICGDVDNCKDKYNSEQSDCDNDNIGDFCDFSSVCSADSDEDSIMDYEDNCPLAKNIDQKDSDGDNIGDSCDPYPDDAFNDIDKDNISGAKDNCPAMFNPSQLNTDSDAFGDICDKCINDNTNDLDADSLCSNIDNCMNAFNPDQSDCDNDNIGDACDTDSDCVTDSDFDSIPDSSDNCPNIFNPDQVDLDKDRIGDHCDFCKQDSFNDIDSDGICAERDNCALISNFNQKDSDSDSIGDFCDRCSDDKYNDIDSDSICGNEDNCPLTSNPAQSDCDKDNIGDVCDQDSLCTKDTDNDELPDNLDNCAAHSNIGQLDSDGDGIGDDCDFCRHDPMNDIDDDGICGDLDNCPIHPNQNQFDSDGDLIGDICDRCMNDPKNDIDGDLLCSNFDNCQAKFNQAQSDCDKNGIGDACDTSACIGDTDNDGIKDNMDNCPEFINQDQADKDDDKIGDACDLCPESKGVDKDQDGICGELDNCPNIFNYDQTDSDKDGFGDACDLCPKDENNDIDEDSICADLDNCPYISNPNQENCEEIVELKIPFDNVLKLKEEKLETLQKLSLIKSNLSDEDIIKNSNILKKSVKVETKEYYLGDEKYTKYKISFETKKPMKDVTYYQSIPKCLAEVSDNIYFNGKNYQVIEKDPLIAWHFSEIADKLEMTYDIKGEINDECLGEVKDFIFSEDVAGNRSKEIVKSLVPLLIISVVIGLTLFLKTYRPSE